jgi:ArsR family transcriptional regulator
VTSQNEIDTVLSVIENPVRRKIIRRLSQEPSYSLEISRELGLGQQLVAAHLGIMEQEGIVGSLTETSPRGPARKIYFLKKSAFLSVGFGPHLYSEHIFSFDTIPNNISKDAERFISRIKLIQESASHAPDMASISDLISEIDIELDKIKDEEAVLLHIRNLAMKHACEVMGKTDKTHDERRVLYYVIDERSRSVENIAAALNLRESVIRSILQSLREELPEM